MILKEEFVTIDAESILDAVDNLPLTEWKYKGSTERHIGPMAQDFYAAFGLGLGAKTIATVDADGVVLAAIQALSQRVQRAECRIQKAEERMLQLEKELAAIKKLLVENDFRRPLQLEISTAVEKLKKAEYSN